jgi:excisionase family DNA binding protein
MQSSDDRGSSTFMSYAEAAQFLGVKVGTLYSWTSRKVIPFARLSPRVVRFRRDDFDQWLMGRTVRATGTKS